MKSRSTKKKPSITISDVIDSAELRSILAAGYRGGWAERHAVAVAERTRAIEPIADDAGRAPPSVTMTAQHARELFDRLGAGEV